MRPLNQPDPKPTLKAGVLRHGKPGRKGGRRREEEEDCRLGTQAEKHPCIVSTPADTPRGEERRELAGSCVLKAV